MVIVELDVGNTRLKWRIREGQQVKHCGAELVASALESLEIILTNLHKNVDSIYIASVVVKWRKPLFDLLLRTTGVTPQFAKTTQYCIGVTNAYSDVTEMGVDRWLALVAAFQRYSADLIVVDAGSAITVDLLQADGLHMGGYIAPGLQMMRQSLFQTDQVAVDDKPYPDQLVPGTSTKQAVLSGLPLMMVGLILRASQQLQSAVNKMPSVVITGGDGLYLTNQLSAQHLSVQFDADLVLDGLEVLLKSESFLNERNH